MLKIWLWITENWQLVTGLGVLVVILALTGPITQTLRAAKKGLKEALTPLGLFVAIIIFYVVYQIYLSISVTL